jgi:hypothetical protein
VEAIDDCFPDEDFVWFVTVYHALGLLIEEYLVKHERGAERSASAAAAQMCLFTFTRNHSWAPVGLHAVVSPSGVAPVTPRLQR